MPTIVNVTERPQEKKLAKDRKIRTSFALFIAIQIGVCVVLIIRGFSGLNWVPLVLAGVGITVGVLNYVILRRVFKAVEADCDLLTEENRALLERGAEIQQALAEQEEREEQLQQALEIAEIQKSMQEHASRRFQSLFEGLPVGAITFDNEGTIFEANPKMSELVGVPGHYAVLHPLAKGLRCEDKPELISEILETVFEKGEMMSYDHSFELEGGERSITLKFFPLRNRDGDILGGIACGLDITDELQAKQKIESMAALQSAVLDAAEYSIVWADQDCKIIGMNAAAEQMLGYDSDDCIGIKTLADFHPPTEMFLRQAEIEAKLGEDLDGVLDVFHHMISQENVSESEWQYLRSDEDTIDVNLSLTALRSEDENVLGYLTVAKNITEQKAIAERLKMLSMVAEQSLNSVLILDASGHILFANPAFTSMTGFGVDEVIGTTPFMFRIGDETDSDEKGAFNETIRRQNEKRGELQMVRPNGESYWSRITITPVRSENGICTHIVVIEDDVTDQKEAQLQIAESEARFRDVVESAGEYIWEVDKDFRFIFVSSKVEDVLGYTPDEMLGHSPLDYIEKAEVRNVQNLIAGSVLDNEPLRNLVLNSHGKFGQQVWQKMNAIPVFDADGELRGFRGTGLDITEQKFAEEALAAANQRVKRILESINDSFYSLDSSGRYTYVNSSAAKNSGVEPGALIGTNVWEGMPEDFWEPVRRLFERVKESGETENLEFMYPPSGSWLDFRAYANQDGGISVFYQDISTRKDTERQIEDQMARLNEAYLQMEIQQSQLQKANEKLMNLASTDGLTGLKNHKTFQEFLADKMAVADRAGISIGVSLMDVDKFKLFNDGFGHLAGDEVLKRVAQTLQKCVQEPHFVARYGGEEFVIVGVGLTEDGMFELAEDCRISLEEQEWPHRQVTASFGVSMYTPEVETRAELIDRADKALYVAKEEGRNRVKRWSDMADKKAA